MTHREDFMHWWKDDNHRALCFLYQAMDAYVKSFPARVQPLLCELIEEHEPPSTTDHDLSVPGIAEPGDPTGGSVEGGVSLVSCLHAAVHLALLTLERKEAIVDDDVDEVMAILWRQKPYGPAERTKT